MDTWGKDHAVSGPTDIPACVAITLFITIPFWVLLVG